jgi:hypothetical protein
MNWQSFKCSISLHNWEHSKEDIEWESSIGKKITISTSIRICQNCHKKQRYSVQGWVDWNKLSKEQLRDKKIKQLGI